MIRVTDIFEGRVKEKALFYAMDMNDAMAMARLLARSGYHVQIGPMNEYTTGVRVRVWERERREGENHESSRAQDGRENAAERCPEGKS